MIGKEWKLGEILKYSIINFPSRDSHLRIYRNTRHRKTNFKTSLWKDRYMVTACFLKRKICKTIFSRHPCARETHAKRLSQLRTFPVKLQNFPVNSSFPSSCRSLFSAISAAKKQQGPQGQSSQQGQTGNSGWTNKQWQDAGYVKDNKGQWTWSGKKRELPPGNSDGPDPKNALPVLCLDHNACTTRL